MRDRSRSFSRTARHQPWRRPGYIRAGVGTPEEWLAKYVSAVITSQRRSELNFNRRSMTVGPCFDPEATYRGVLFGTAIVTPAATVRRNRYGLPLEILASAMRHTLGADGQAPEATHRAGFEGALNLAGRVDWGAIDQDDCGTVKAHAARSMAARWRARASLPPGSRVTLRWQSRQRRQLSGGGQGLADDVAAPEAVVGLVRL